MILKSLMIKIGFICLKIDFSFELKEYRDYVLYSFLFSFNESELYYDILNTKLMGVC